uniref:Patched family protein n=1 Tax=Plectus sambesii TaxID=2011161 RepID=A0A914W8X1_9BILA
MQEGLDYEKLVTDDDPIRDVIMIEKVYFSAGHQAEIAIVNAPDMTKKSNRDRILKVVNEYETTKYSVGPKGTQLWLREYERYQNATGAYMKDDRDTWINGVYEWTQLFAFYRLWSQDFVWSNAQEPDMREMKSFRFRIAIKNYDNIIAFKRITALMREIAGKYPDLNITTFQLYRALADQNDAILPNTVQNCLIELLCIGAVGLVFIPNVVFTFWIILAIISIDIGVVGCLSWWSVKLDPISMITLIMSIGFSVEFTAHITYGFVSSKGDLSPKERTAQALEKHAVPVLQGAISTVLGVSVLAFINSYTVTIFFKAVFLVVSLGALHALVFLPVFLSRTAPLINR